MKGLNGETGNLTDKRFANLVRDLATDDVSFRKEMERLSPADRTYVVVFSARSGSTWLTSVLSGTKQLGYPEEYLNPNFVRSVAQSLNTRDPEGLLEMLKRRRSTPNGVFGIEVRAVDVRLLDEATFFRVFGAETVFFHLWRQNSVAQGISLFRAVKSGHFHSTEGREGVPPPPYDADEIKYWLRHVVNTEIENRRMLERAARPVRILRYEDIVLDRIGTIRLFAQALDVPLQPEALPEPAKGAVHKIGDGWNIDAERRFRQEQALYVAEMQAALQDRERVFGTPLLATSMPARPVSAVASAKPPTMSLPDLQGRFYQDCLRDIHRVIAPQTYFEIGTMNGDTLRLASCHSIAVDPAMRLSEPAIGEKPALQLFRIDSDRFFARHDPTALFGGAIDLAFLDGMHLVEFLLRDFINTERACRVGSTIVLHDCVPLDPFMATRDAEDKSTRSRSRHPLWWTGDVWKIVPILRHYRSDLSIATFDASPTGLVVVTGLDPHNCVLSEHYAAIVSPEPGCAWHSDGIGNYLSNLTLTQTSHLPEYLRAQRLSDVRADQ